MSRDVSYGVFLPVGSGGFIPSSTAPRNPGSYEHNKRVVQLAESLGLDFAVAMARWRGFGGATGYSDQNLEAITTMAGLAECTDSISLFPTMHCVVIHPAVAAKMAATMSDIAGGRIGINVVAGSNPVDHGQMGLWKDVPHNELYDIAAEWTTVVKRLWTEDHVGLDGKYFSLTDCRSDPKPAGCQLPPLLCAATSDTGMRFTIENASASLVNGGSIEDLISNGRRAKELGVELGKPARAVGLVMVVPGATDEEAQQRVAHYNRGVDAEAIETRTWQFSASAKEFGRVENHRREVERSHSASGELLAVTKSALVGTATTIADGMATIIDEGEFEWIGLYFPDYINDLRVFGEEVLPRLGDRGFPAGSVPLG